MRLLITAITYRNRQPDHPVSASFDREGGGIGRLASPENRLHLPDPDKYISRRHALIKFEDGAYYLTDTSTAGTFCINRNQSVHRDTLRLEDGDRLRIGDYELSVRVTTDTADDEAFASPPLETTDGDPFFDSGAADWSEEGSTGGGAFEWSERHPFEGPVESESFTPPAIDSSPAANEIPADFDINQLLDGGGGAVEPPSRDPLPDSSRQPQEPGSEPRGTLNHGGAPAPSPEPNAPQPSRPRTPSGGEPQRKRRLRSAISQTLTEPAAPRAAAAGSPMEAFLKAAGLGLDDIPPGTPPEEIMQTLGALFKELVGGLMTTLQARSELKSQFRVSMTVIQPVENNPLKFSARSKDALKQLLHGDDAAFLDPVTAVRESFEDIGNHQLALAAGIQSSLMELLKRFDPEHFEKHFDRGLAIQRHAKSWNAYREAYEDIVRVVMEEIFGSAFSQAYERQIQKLRSARKNVV